jgi:hypothetical protein
VAAGAWDKAALRLRADAVTLIPFGCALLRRAAFPLQTR